VARLIASLGEYVYSVGDNHVAVHLFVAGTADLQLGGRRVSVRQTHDYPWDGRIRIDVDPERPAAFGLWLRLPGWCRDAQLRINDVVMDTSSVLARGYLRLERGWRSGDRIQLDLAMPVERTYAHPAVADAAGSVALQRGPIVYCLEEADNPACLHDVLLPREAPLEARFEPQRLGGVMQVGADALVAETDDWDGQLHRRWPPRLRRQPIVAVPYAVWDNRADGQMRVWIRDVAGA
jgi:uncharacterized protein